MAHDTSAIAEAIYLAKKPSETEYRPLEVRIFRPVRADEEGDFKGMWVCRCSISGVVEFSEAFPGVDSLGALEYAQVIAASYFGQLCEEFDVRRPSRTGPPMEIPLMGKSFLASLLQGREAKLPRSN